MSPDSLVTGPATATPLTWSREFLAVPPQVREARRFLASILAGSGAADDAALCLAELAANAVTHSKSREPDGHFTVRAEMRVGWLRVEVQDGGGPWIWTARQPDGPDGRGLLIVSQLARAWGRTGSSDTGWAVWFEMGWPDACPPLRLARNRHRRARPARTHHPQPRHPAGETTMIEPSHAAPGQYNTEDMHAIQAGLAACGLTTHARAGLDLTATLRPSGKHDAEFWIDEDGYAEVRYWNLPGTLPAEVTATALRVLRALSGTSSDPPPGPE